MSALLLTDAYKLSHHQQYPPGTELVFSNFTPRSNNHAPSACKNGVVVFGVQLAIKKLVEEFDDNFFFTSDRTPISLKQLKQQAIEPLKEQLNHFFGSEYDTSHFEKLWDLGYLPLEIRSLEEGSMCPIKVPMMTIHNTHPDFFWLPNFLETILSQLLWKPMTSATIALAYRQILTRWAVKTNPDALGFVLWQGHDFSMRGLDAVDATIASGLGHLTSFYGTDSLPCIYGASHYYNEPKAIMSSVSATEHSVMCSGTKEDELGTFRRLLKTYPKGILSIVSDTWDLWNVCTNILPTLKDEIMAREGKIVIRPDSGDPADILCGINGFFSPQDRPKHLGVVQLLWEVFGGTINTQGYKVLDPHIGAIYGDSITHAKAEEICRRLHGRGFASTNVVFGIGSYTYQYNTRDTFGFAMKATYVEKQGVGYEIFKDPITDGGMKKSAKGLLKVIEEGEGGEEKELILKDQISWAEVMDSDNKLEVVFRDGKFIKEVTLSDVRKNIDKLVNLKQDVEEIEVVQKGPTKLFTNNLNYKVTQYPDGTQYVTVGEGNQLVFRINTYNDLWTLEQINDVLLSKGRTCMLCIPNLLDAQADRRFNSDESNGLKLVCKRLNSLSAFNPIQIYHPHNAEVVEALIDRVNIIDNTAFISYVLNQFLNQIDTENLILMSPDAGAYKMLMKLSDKLGWTGETYSASKSRKYQDGHSKITQVVDRTDFGGKDILIIDDLCIFGGTFKGLSNILKTRNCGKLYLAVSHVTVEDLGKDPVTKYFDRVFCTNSKFDTYDTQLEVVQLF